MFLRWPRHEQDSPREGEVGNKLDIVLNQSFLPHFGYLNGKTILSDILYSHLSYSSAFDALCGTSRTMDRLSQRRDETAPRSRRSQPRRTKTLNKSYSESPSKPERPKIKKEKTSAKKNKEPEGKLYATKDQAILSEKRGTNGEIVYLVNWADDPVTGQTYAPGWVRSSSYHRHRDTYTNTVTRSPKKTLTRLESYSGRNRSKRDW